MERKNAAFCEWEELPRPAGLAWFLRGAHQPLCEPLAVHIAKTMPKGFYGMNVALCEIMLQFAKLNDWAKQKILMDFLFCRENCVSNLLSIL
jgi:hypothetical protein